MSDQRKDPSLESAEHRTPGSRRHVADLFVPLSDPTLLRLLEFIFERDRTMPECGAYLDLPNTRVERHLRSLADSGWIKERLVGGSRFYGPPSAQVVEFMTLAGSMASERSNALASCSRINTEAGPNATA